jgi:hypothetical protein
VGFLPFATTGYPSEPVVSGAAVAGDVLTAESATAAAWVEPAAATFLLEPSGDTSGATDVTNITAAAAAGQVLAPGIFYVNAPVVLGTAGMAVLGSGFGTVLTIVAGFTGSEIFSMAANSGTVESLSVIGASSTIASNPAANAIELNGYQHCRFDNLFMQYVNGYMLESVGGASVANLDTMIGKIVGRNCAGGVHVQGVSGTSFQGEHFIDNLQVQQIGTATGPNANLDCLFLEDVEDILIENFNGSISDVGTGSTLHIKGACAGVQVTNFDLGCYPNGSGSNSVCLIEDSANGHCTDSDFNGGSFQQGAVGLTVNGGASRITWLNTRFSDNFTHGCVIGGSGIDLFFGAGCVWNGNGAGASGVNYDFNLTGTAQGWVKGSYFLTPVTAEGTAGVQGVAGIASSGQAFEFKNVEMAGTGTQPSSAFSNLPRRIRDVFGYNPHGNVSGWSIPASGSGSASLHYDAYHYITAGVGGCTIQRNTNGGGGATGPVITIPALTCVTVFVPAIGTLTPTYTNVPTSWVVDGN